MFTKTRGPQEMSLQVLTETRGGAIILATGVRIFVRATGVYSLFYKVSSKLYVSIALVRIL